MKLICLFLMGLLALDPLSARVFTLDLNGNEAPLVNSSDQVTYDADGVIQRISGTTEASVKVFLPDAEKNTGAAVIICSGGALMFHSWGNDVEKMAAWLNERGIAVIGLKYRLRQMQPRPAAPAPGNTPVMRLQLPDITGFDQLKNANASPDQSGAQDPSLAPAAEDAIRTIRLVRAHAAEWGIDPNRVGYLGYSAGGGVAIEATLRADTASMPSFLASCYGPSLTDVSVPDHAPKLFIAVRAQHNNVAAGMLALFLEWKKSGANAEMYIYDDGQGPFGPGDDHSTSGAWREHFYRWMVSNGWVKPDSDSQ
ncbi:MAG: alpha/beta hydrolase fold domain-containing protein [Bacteroidales bacterium]|nr:alpha/beta hydrolase fold domain-containing protein [Bacteroidales bacterium]